MTLAPDERSWALLSSSDVSEEIPGAEASLVE